MNEIKKGLNYLQNDIFLLIYQNQVLMKLLHPKYINLENPLEQPDLELREIDRTQDSNIVKNPFLPYTDKYKAQMNFIITNVRTINRENRVLLEGNASFTFVCHKDVWSIKQGSRAYEFVEELKALLNEEKIGVYQLIFENIRFVRINDTDFAGYEVNFKFYQMARAFSKGSR